MILQKWFLSVLLMISGTFTQSVIEIKVKHCLNRGRLMGVECIRKPQNDNLDYCSGAYSGNRRESQDDMFLFIILLIFSDLGSNKLGYIEIYLFK
jgi:hypothetical protein